MEGSPSGEDSLELVPIGWEIVVEDIDAENAVEVIGKTQQDRLEDIDHARQFRGELRADALRRVTDSRDFTASFFGKRIRRMERRRESYVEQYEERDQSVIEDLLSALDLNNPEDQALLLDKLRQVYADLKTRLVIVEMETRRQIYNTYGHITGTRDTTQERLQRIFGTADEREIDAAGLLLIDIDSLRSDGLDDKSIYRQLMRKYHPDVSDHEKAKEITQLLSAVYNGPNEQFLI